MESLPKYLRFCERFGNRSERAGARALRTILRNAKTGNIRNMRAALRRLDRRADSDPWAVEHAWTLCFELEMTRALARA